MELFAAISLRTWVILGIVVLGTASYLLARRKRK